MIIPEGARGRLVLLDIIPATALLGTVGVTVQNNRFFRGFQLRTNCTAIAGGGQYRPQVIANVGTSGNTMLLATYSTFIGASSFIMYPGCDSGPIGTSLVWADGVLPESFQLNLQNISAVPGNECNISLSICLIE